MIRGVLLIPPGGDPAGLLKGGVGGSEPPVATLCRHCGRAWSLGMVCEAEACVEAHREHVIGTYCLPPSREALVLAWDGEVSEVGCVRVVGLGPAQRLRPMLSLRLKLIRAGEGVRWGDVISMLAKRGRVCFVDADGREIELETSGA